jgi:hypothetical protein
MLDPRIYRMGLLPVVLAVIVLAFSLGDQQGALSTNLAPDAYSGGYAYTQLQTMANISANRGGRRPGSEGDFALASYVAGQLRGSGFSVSTDSFRGHTIDGTRGLENVVGVRAGLNAGSIVLVADRSSLQAPATAELSGTAVLLALAHVVSGETLHRTVVLASVSGAAGAAGAARLARTLPQPVDAVIVLGDMAGTTVREPVVVPWSNGQLVAPTALGSTVASVLNAQAGLPGGSTGLGGQIAHLAFPMAASEQAPFGSSGLSAVLLSASSEQGPTANALVSPGQMTGFGRSLTQTISALDSGPELSAPSSYVSFAGKSVPAWAVRFLTLMLIAAVMGATIDGLARARRRGHPITRWVVWVLSAALPFCLAALVVIGARAVRLIGPAPAVPIAGSAIVLHHGAAILLAVLALVILLGLIWLRPLLIRAFGPPEPSARSAPHGPGAAAAVLLVLTLVALAVWVANPFAALLLVPALHLWMWIVVPEVRIPLPGTIVLLLAGLAAPVLVALYYALTLGLDPIQLAWSWVLLLAGGGVGLMSALEWGIVAGCTFSVIAIAVRARREPRPAEAPVTIRGPISYAGPGSLGGTESALRR